MLKILSGASAKLRKMVDWGQKQKDAYGEKIVRKQARILAIIFGLLFFQLTREFLSAVGIIDIPSDFYLLLFGIIFLYLFGLTAKKLVATAVGLLIISSLILIVDAQSLANHLAVFAYFLITVAVLLQVRSLIIKEIDVHE